MQKDKHAQGRLTARPTAPTEAVTAGLHPLGLEAGRDGVLYVPRTYQPDRSAPLIVILHGAGGQATRSIGYLQGAADAAGIVLLAIDSRRPTWDIIAERRFGTDVAFIDRALAHTFARCAIDPARVALNGFSDGASYALSLGLSNGDLFTHILAFSPGFMTSAIQQGKPRIFIAHGTRDAVLPIERCSRRIAPQLEQAGYDVTYHEFDGPHTVPPTIAEEGVRWFLSKKG